MFEALEQEIIWRTPKTRVITAQSWGKNIKQTNHKTNPGTNQ